MTPAAYFEVAHWVARHVDRERPSWRGRRKLRKALRRLREKIPSFSVSEETARRYRR